MIIRLKKTENGEKKIRWIDNQQMGRQSGTETQEARTTNKKHNINVGVHVASDFKLPSMREL